MHILICLTAEVLAQSVERVTAKKIKAGGRGSWNNWEVKVLPLRSKRLDLRVVKFFFLRLRNYCFAVYFYLFVNFSGLFLPATLTCTRDVYPHPHPRPLPTSSDPRHLGILAWPSCKCRVTQKLRNSSVLYHKTKNPFEAKICMKISLSCSNASWK